MSNKPNKPGGRFEENVVTLDWSRRGKPRFSRLPAITDVLPGGRFRPPLMPNEDLVKQQKAKTEALGDYKLWAGYNQEGAERNAKQVSTTILRGRFYSYLVQQFKPKVLVEFGSAFGVSGMYWMTGIESNQHGHLYTYEVNKEWAEIAKGNIQAIGRRFTLTADLFEENIKNTIGRKKIDLAFIDGVHTSEWVIPQYELILTKTRRGAVVILDDIAFSDDMEACWQELSQRDNVVSAFRLNGRVGVLQVK